MVRKRERERERESVGRRPTKPAQGNNTRDEADEDRRTEKVPFARKEKKKRARAGSSHPFHPPHPVLFSG
jgi:hypothetical protein